MVLCASEKEVAPTSLKFKMSPTINKNKYENVILYLCKQLGGELHGKKKLAKLLYFVDFDSFEKNDRPITGDVYKALPMGPVPSSLQEITVNMEGAGLLQVESVPNGSGYNPTEVYKCLKNPELSIFTDEEKKILDRVVLKYGHLNGRQLEELTHAEAPYNGTEPQQEIPYELAYYRATDFSDA